MNLALSVVPPSPSPPPYPLSLVVCGAAHQAEEPLVVTAHLEELSHASSDVARLRMRGLLRSLVRWKRWEVRLHAHSIIRAVVKLLASEQRARVRVAASGRVCVLDVDPAPVSLPARNRSVFASVASGASRQGCPWGCPRKPLGSAWTRCG